MGPPTGREESRVRPQASAGRGCAAMAFSVRGCPLCPGVCRGRSGPLVAGARFHVRRAGGGAACVPLRFLEDSEGGCVRALFTKEAIGAKISCAERLVTRGSILLVSY